MKMFALKIAGATIVVSVNLFVINLMPRSPVHQLLGTIGEVGLWIGLLLFFWKRYRDTESHRPTCPSVIRGIGSQTHSCILPEGHRGSHIRDTEEPW